MFTQTPALLVRIFDGALTWWWWLGAAALVVAAVWWWHTASTPLRGSRSQTHPDNDDVTHDL